MHLTDKQKGIALSLIGVLVITPDSLLIRLINIPSWELLFYRGLIPFVLLFILLQSSCGIRKSWEETGRYTSEDSLQSTYIWKKGKQYIALVSTIPIPGRYIKNTIHPIKISPSTIQRSFSKVKYSTKEGGKLKRAFNDRNVELLSKYLPEALVKARKHDVLFEIFQLRKKLWVLPTTIDTTAGYIFVESGRINIVFEKINEDEYILPLFVILQF